MPELPEVETTLRGLSSHLLGQRITDAVIRTPQLRWAILKQLPVILRGQIIRALRRRAKYLLIECDSGTLILHLGMSGSLRISLLSVKSSQFVRIISHAEARERLFGSGSSGLGL